MVRAQIQFTEEQLRLLRTTAKSEGVSVAEVVRRCVGRVLTEEKPSRQVLYSRAATLVGRFHDREEATDLSARHDDYLDEAYR